MRKLYLSLLLPLLMLLAQQGAFWHEIGHLAYANTSTSLSSHQREQHPIDKVCETCLAFDQIAGIAKSEVVTLDLLTFAFGLASVTAASVITADAPALRNRGPPFFL